MLRRELHFGDRVLPCYADRPADLGALVRATFFRMAEAEAVIDGDRRMTYAGLEAASDRVAGALAAAGVAQGDRVGLLLGNRAEIVTAWLACIRLGAIAVPLNTREQKPELTYVLGNCGAKAVIFEDELADRLPDALRLGRSRGFQASHVRQISPCPRVASPHRGHSCGR